MGHAGLDRDIGSALRHPVKGRRLRPEGLRLRVLGLVKKGMERATAARRQVPMTGSGLLCREEGP
jgi:hypothetical protein